MENRTKSRQKGYVLLWIVPPILFAALYPYFKSDPAYLKWLTTGIVIYVLFFSVVVHELCHGFAARFCGDNTAEEAGRLSFNPLRHVSVVGTIMVPLVLHLMKASFVIGWAKPVPFNPVRLRHHPRDQVLLTLAGPLSNFALAYISFSIFLVAGALFNIAFPQSPVRLNLDILTPMALKDVPCDYLFFVLFQSLSVGIVINVILGVFNLMPFPPLDGSWILKALLPKKLAVVFGKVQIFGFLLIMVALYFNLLNIFFYPAMIFLSILQTLAIFWMG